jgi:hypothetical protein
VLTAAITTAIAGILSLFGVKASLAQLAVVALVVKALIVFSGLFFGTRLMKRRQAAAAAQEKAAEPEHQ